MIKKDKFNYKDVPWNKYDAVLVSDHGKGFLRECGIRDICQYHDNVFLDSNKVKINCDLPVNLTFLKVNQYEFEVNPFLKHHVMPSVDAPTYTRPDQIIVT